MWLKPRRSSTGFAKREISLMQRDLFGAAGIIKQLKSRKRSSLYIWRLSNEAGASYKRAVLSCKTTQPAESQTGKLFSNSNCFWLNWRRHLFAAFLYKESSPPPLCRGVATIYISFLLKKRYSHLQLMGSQKCHVMVEKLKLKELKGSQPNQVLQISLNRCWNQWPEA